MALNIFISVEFKHLLKYLNIYTSIYQKGFLRSFKKYIPIHFNLATVLEKFKANLL